MRDLIGHARILDPLAERALRGEIAHAYGIFGARSVGKRSAALRLAQTLLCPGGVPGGCGSCRACRNVERGVHPDLRLVTRAAGRKLISIEQIRAMQEDLALRPLEGRWRVVIVDDAAEMDQGQDALLKTLEEPPAHAVLILVSTRPAELHETVRSRLQPIVLRTVPTVEIAQGLRARGIADAEAPAAAAGGVPGIAVELASTDAARSERAKVESELYRLVGSGLTDRFRWAAELNELPDDAESDRRRTREIERRFTQWAELLRDAAVAARGELVRPLRPARTAESTRLAGVVSDRDLLASALLVERLRRDLAFTANARAMLELFALKLPYAKALAA